MPAPTHATALREGRELGPVRVSKNLHLPALFMFDSLPSTRCRPQRFPLCFGASPNEHKLLSFRRRTSSYHQITDPRPPHLRRRWCSFRRYARRSSRKTVPPLLTSLAYRTPACDAQPTRVTVFPPCGQRRSCWHSGRGRHDGAQRWRERHGRGRRRRLPGWGQPRRWARTTAKEGARGPEISQRAGGRAQGLSLQISLEWRLRRVTLVRSIDGPRF